MKASLINLVLLVLLFAGIAPLAIARTTSQSTSAPIEIKRKNHQDEKRSATLPIPITASIDKNQLVIDFLTPLGEVAVTISSEKGSVLTVNYMITSAQTVFIYVDNMISHEQYQIEFLTVDEKRYWGDFVME